MAEGTGGRTPRQLAHEAYRNALALLSAKAAHGATGHEVNKVPREAAYHGFIGSAVDLMLTGLDEYLAAAAQDRASAEEDRRSAREARAADRLTAAAELVKQGLDREQQAADRRLMSRLTFILAGSAIATFITAIVSASAAYHAAYATPSPPKVETNWFPVVRVPEVPVTLSPVINVLPSSHSPK